MTDALDLANRPHMPDALRALVAAFPRDAWLDHPNYSQMIAFWLSRHMMFRQVLDQLLRDADTALEGSMDPQTYKARVHRFAGLLVNELHTHHTVEDTHYFPTMAKLDDLAERGFAILDRDHHAMDGLLHRLADGANGVLRAASDDVVKDKTGDFKSALDGFAPLLNRHLVDEEELVVPLLLKYAPEQFKDQ